MGIINVINQHYLEKRKAKYTRLETLEKELGTAVQQFSINVSSALHSMCWLTWAAKMGADYVSQERIDKYDDELHATLPKIMGYLSTIAALDVSLFVGLQEQSSKIIGLDARIGEACLLHRTNPNVAAERLANFYSEAVSFEKTMALDIGKIAKPKARGVLEL